MSGMAAATIPQKNNTTTTCSWCSSRVSNKSCREKKSMSFNMTRNASPQNTARRTRLNQNSCARVVSPRPPETGPSFQAFSAKFGRRIRRRVGGGNAPRVSITPRRYSATRQPLSIDVQAPLYTHLEVTMQPLTVTPIPHTRATRIRSSFHLPPRRSRSSWIVLAFVLTGILLATSLSALAGGPTPMTSFASASATGRVATLWPFSRDSIWNLPIGANAVYVPTQIAPVSGAGMTTDQDVLILTPSEPMTPVYYNSDAWTGRSRCTAQGGVLFDAPIPSDFVVPGASHSDTPNFATAILMADGHTLMQGQPMARCTANGTATMWWYIQNDLYGTGLYGGHGGSMLSSLGGTIRHAMKVNLYGAANYYYDSATQGYRWPAKQADSCAASCYGGTNPALRMGSLLAIPASKDINSMGLETQPALMLAKAFRDYGAYVVDDTAWPVYGIETEFSPQGHVEDEFQAAWGFAINPAGTDVPWARDMARIFGAVDVVDNWDANAWQAVSASNGTEGAGGGAPRVPWAPGFGPDSVPPVTTASLSGSPGSANWFVSPVDVTLTATDDSSGVASIHFRIDGGTWQLYANPVTVPGDGSHTVDYYATDLAGNNETARTATFQIDTVGPVSSAQVSGTLANDGSYLSSVIVTLTSSDATSGIQSEQYRIDGGPWRTYSAPFTVGGNGTHMLDYFATDVAGNSEAVRGQSIWITGDLHPIPVSTLTATGTTGASGWYVSAVTVTITATSGSGSAVSIEYRLDGNAWATYATPIVVLDGRHILEYLATDAQGYSEASKSAAINVDSPPPSLLATVPSVPLAPDGSVSWSGSDGGSGIARYEVAIDGSAFISVGLQTTLTRTWTEGTHVVSVRAYDAAGNMKSAVIQFSVASNPTPASPSGAPGAPPGIPEIIVGLVIVAVSVWFRPRVVSRRPARRA